MTLKLVRRFSIQFMNLTDLFNEPGEAHGDNIMLFEAQYPHKRCYLLEGAVKIKRNLNESRKEEIPLFYIEIEL